MFVVCSPDFGVQGVLDRFGQIEPKVLIACDGYWYNGKPIGLADKLAEIVQRLPSVERVLVVPYLEQREVVQGLNGLDCAAPPCGNMGGCGPGALGRAADVRALSVPAAPLHPVFLGYDRAYPSASCIRRVEHLLKHLCEHRLHTDVKPGDRLFYFTTCGWMMWNWLVSGLASGATLLLYDGAPFHPSGRILWDYAETERCTHFGTSAPNIWHALKKAELAPARTHDLSSLRAIMSTGSPLAQESFDYVYEEIKRDVHLASISGGTDIVGCFVLGDPTKPVWRGELQGRAWAWRSTSSTRTASRCRTARASSSARGRSRPCRSASGTIRTARYRAAYFDRVPDVWRHGDFAEWTEHDGIIIHGRSDATLNPGGVRIGTAEIYRQVEQLEAVQEPRHRPGLGNDVRVVLFVMLRRDVLDEALATRSRSRSGPRRLATSPPRSCGR